MTSERSGWTTAVQTIAVFGWVSFIILKLSALAAATNVVSDEMSETCSRVLETQYGGGSMAGECRHTEVALTWVAMFILALHHSMFFLHYELFKVAAHTFYAFTYVNSESRSRHWRLVLSVTWFIAMTTYATHYSFFIPGMYINDRWAHILFTQMMLSIAHVAPVAYTMHLFSKLRASLGSGSTHDAEIDDQKPRQYTSYLSAVALGCLLFKLGFNIFFELMGMVCGTSSKRSIYFITCDLSMFSLLIAWDKPLRDQLKNGAEKGPHRLVTATIAASMLMVSLWGPATTC